MEYAKLSRRARKTPFLFTFAILLLLGGCAASTTGTSDGRHGTAGRATLHDTLDNLYRSGRLSRLSERIAADSVLAERDAPDVLGLLLAAQGRVTEGLGFLGRAVAAGGQTGLCLPLDMALVAFYQKGDAEGTLRALDKVDAGTAGCRGEVMGKVAAALRARALGGTPLFLVDGPPGEQVVPLDPIAANAGYLVARLSFDREHSGQFLLSTGAADLFLDTALAKSLRLVEQTERPMPARDVPGLEGTTNHFTDFPTATVHKAQFGLFTLREVPVLVADLSELRDKFKKRISRDVQIDGVLPLQRLVGSGYLRIDRRGTELRLATDGSAAGPCRLQYPFSTPLYQLTGALFADGSLADGQTLLMRVDLGQRRTLVRQSALRYTPGDIPRQGGESDVARPVITEPEVHERLVQVLLHLGQAQMVLHHVPLQPTEVTALRQPEEHGTIGTDIPGDFDLMIDPGDGHLFLSPPDRVRCGS
jgi:hypothetical protein